MLLPSSLVCLRTVRLARILRLLKLGRYYERLSAIGKVIESKRTELFGSIVVIVMLMLLSSLIIYSVEHEAQPGVFKNLFSGMWWVASLLIKSARTRFAP